MPAIWLARLLALCACVISGPAFAQSDDMSAIFDKAMAAGEDQDDWDARAEALKGFATVCESGLAKACYNAGVMAERSYESDAAFDWMKKACDRNKLVACYYVADKLAFREPSNVPGARALFGKTCAQGMIAACLRFGAMLETGEGGTEDNPKAFDVYKRACAAKSAAGCDRLANFLRYRDGFGNDDLAARNAFEIACSKGSWSACSSLADMLREGRGGPKDPARASDLLMRVCLDGDNTGACDSMLLTLDK
ncbi:tetratricopeptide repeat protein [Blastomonas sp.]|uniref:tetratricopeptide repeat protein n=1 Tax=Blastomonas sp. TaxID=1909299 RepID=UPI003592F904